MRALKIAAVVVALLFILVVFQNSYSMAVAQAKNEENEKESSLPEVKNREQSFSSEPISSVPGPPASTPISVPASVPASASTSVPAPAPTSTPAPVPTSTPSSAPISASTSTPASAPASTSNPASALEAPEALKERSITEPREQFAITEAVLLIIAFVVLLVLFIIMIPVFILIAPIVLVLLPLLVPVDFLFVLLVMFLPVILASFADLSTYEIPVSIQQILNDIGSKGTVTEILFAYFKNLWRIVLNLPDIARLTGDLNTEDYAALIKSSGSFILNYPANLRALPNKILRNLFPTVNALPAWLRQSPVLLQVFPLQMYTLIFLSIIALIIFTIFMIWALTIALILLLVFLVLASPFIIFFGAIFIGALFFALGFFGGAAVGVIGGIITFFLALIGFTGFGAIIGAIIGGVIGLVIAIALVWVYGWAIITIPIGFAIGLIIGGIIGIIIGGIIGLIIGAVIGGIAFIVVLVVCCFLGLALGIILGIIVAIIALFVIPAILILVLIILLILLFILFIVGVPIILFLLVLLVIFILPLMLPIGPQAVKSYPAIFRLSLSLAENSIAIPVGCMALPVSALISVFRGLPGSLRSVLYHTIDFTLTPFLFAMRALPLLSTFVVLILLWLLGMLLALIFSPILLIAPVFIVLAIFVEGLKDKDIDAISDEGIKASIDNLPESVGEVDKVIKRMAEMLEKAATTDISGLLDSLLGVNWLIATQNLPDVLPEAMQSIGSAVPAIINSCPDIIKTLIDSGMKFTIDLVGYLSETIIAQIRNIFALIWALPEFAILIPQLLEILSVLTINLPALIKGFIPASIDAVEQTTISCPELFPSIVLSTMGLNVIVLQFARAVWDISMNIAKIIIEFLWLLILLLPATIFDFDDFVTPWFGPRLLSIVGVCIGAIPAGIIGALSMVISLIISGFLSLGMCCYLPTMILMQLINALIALIKFCCFPVTACSSCLSLSLLFISGCSLCISVCGGLCIPICGGITEFCISLCAGIIDALCQYPVSDVLIGIVVVIQAVLVGICYVLLEICGVLGGIVAFIQGIVAMIMEPITALLTACGDITTVLSFFANWLLPVFFLILVIIALFPLMGLVAAFVLLAIIYILWYILQIIVGTILMACSGVFQSVVFVPLMSLCEDVPVVSTILGYFMTLTGFYAFCIPPNFIEIITQLIPFSVNLIASCPALMFMPISLLQTFISTSSRAVGALPSVPAYIGRLIDRTIFSVVAWILAMCSLAIDIIVAVMLICFALSTGLIAECISLDILVKAPKIAILVLALIWVTFAWIIDLCGVLCLRTPDMIDEYTLSILKSMAMMPVLSAIIPDMAAAPAAMQPEVVSEGLSKILIIVILFIPAVLGAFVTLIYNLVKQTVLWCYNTCPALVTLPCRLPTIVLNRLNEIFSQVGSIIGRAAGSVESQLLPY